MKTAARRASAAALTLTLTQQPTAFRAANAADAATKAANTASAAPTAAEGAQSIDGVASRGTSKPHPRGPLLRASPAGGCYSAAVEAALAHHAEL